MKFVKAEREHLERVLLYRDARQKREIFEGLRDTQQTSYDRTEAHREQERVDEAFLIRSSGDSIE
jgi:flagellar biosynthesis chaperone FliJ